MTSPRILVQYHIADTTPYGAACVKQLVTDIQTCGAKVMISHNSSRRSGLAAPSQDRMLCHWFILVQDAEALQSLRVQTPIATALTLLRQKQIPGIQFTIATPFSPEEEQKSKSTLDSVRTQTHILLEMRLLPLTDGSERTPQLAGTAGLLPSRAVGDLRSSSLHARKGVHRQGHQRTRQTLHPLPARMSHRLWMVYFSLVLGLLLVIGGVASTMLQSSQRTGNPIVTSTPSGIHTESTVTVHKPDASPTSIRPTAIPNSPPSDPQELYTWATMKPLQLNDSLSQRDHAWFEGSDSGRGSCQFADGAYHVWAPGLNHYTRCLLSDSTWQDFAFQVRMDLQGDAGGLLFRSNPSNLQSYAFADCALAVCPEGTYGLYLLPAGLLLLPLPRNTDVQSGTTTLTVIALGSDIHLYVNQKQVALVHDQKLRSGAIGVFAYGSTHGTLAAFNHAQVWKL